MQSDYKQIYKELGGEDDQVYKDIGNFIFAETARMLRQPTSLILKLKGVGAWHLRKKRMDIIVDEYPDRGLVKVREEFETENGWLTYLEKKEQYDMFVERLKDYDEYLAIKRQVREKRNETQVLIQPVDRKDERFKSGED